LPRGVFVVDGYANWDNAGGHRVKVRVVAERPYHALFMRNMLIRPSEQELAQSFGEPDLVIYNAGHLAANRYGTGGGSKSSVALNLKAGEMVILGTEYAGEMKKGVFTYMHWAMPKQGVLSLHSGCNVGEKGDTTLFFGLSGTGKTTLSTDPHRPLVGDDEHCWADDGVTNIEGGCYAKTIGLKSTTEPEIFQAIRFGAVLENVVVDPHTRAVDYSSNAITENTRACYPIEHIANARVPCRAGHPRNIILLCCDARGVLPPVAKLSLEQAMYHFISGYTSKVAGTEMGVTEPEATFSACYGGAFLIWHPMKYAAMLADKMQQHGARAWLVNTGWCGGGAADGSGAKRVPLKHTRAIVDAVHAGDLDDADFSPSPIFGLQVPHGVPSVPDEWLDQRVAWRAAAERRGKDADEAERHYKGALEGLAELFVANFNTYLHDAEAHVGEALAERILSGGPDRAWATAHGGHGLHDEEED
jgi:phosphoenolpyruvate carboxykinase (ATP)